MAINIQAFSNDELIFEEKLSNTQNSISATDNTEFKLIDAKTKLLLEVENASQIGNDLLIRTQGQEFTIKNYFAYNNTSFVNADITLSQSAILEPASEPLLAEQLATSAPPTVTKGSFSPVLIGLGVAGLAAAAAGGGGGGGSSTNNNANNNAPTDIVLSNQTVTENSIAAKIGKLTTTDTDSSTFTYSVSDSRFVVDANGVLSLKANTSIDYEAEQKITISITSTDDTGLSVKKDFTITVSNVIDTPNNAPSNITLNNNSISENSKGAIIGTLSTVDVDKADTFTYSVDNNQFEIVNNQLKLKDNISLNYEDSSQVSINITSTDNRGASITKNITLQVLDQNETLPASSTLPLFMQALYDTDQKFYDTTPSGWAGLGQSRHINYSFESTRPAGSTETNFVAYTDAQKSAVRDALKLYSDKFNLTFTEVSEGSTTADFKFYLANLGSANLGGYASLSTATDSNDIFINTTTFNSVDPILSAEGKQTVIHEIGHAFGLKHPGDYNNGKEPGPYLPASQDNWNNTIMSYYPVSSATASQYPDKLGMFDLATLEYMYGINNSVNAGDTTYTYQAMTNFISDGSGTDTLDISSSNLNFAINLMPGNWNYATQKSTNILDTNQFFIGNDTIIENLNTGRGNDTITGNNAANTINSGEGNDTINGGLGVDIIKAQSGNDTIIYDISDYVDGGIGKDTLKVTTQKTIASGEFARVKNIEVLDLSDSTVQKINLSTSDVLAMTDSNNSLWINGNASDTVTLTGSFATGSNASGYNQYSHAGSTVWVDTDITVSIV